MNEISAIYLKAGTSGNEYVVKDALVRAYALSSQDLSLGIEEAGKTLDLSAKGALVGSVPLSDFGSQVWIEDRISGISGFSDLSVVKLSSSEYAQLVISGDILSNCIYIVNGDYVDAYGQQIKHVAPPTDLSDAATKEYVDNALSQVSVALQSKADISAFSALSGIANPKASVISLQETLISVLTVLKGLT